MLSPPRPPFSRDAGRIFALRYARAGAWYIPENQKDQVQQLSTASGAISSLSGRDAPAWGRNPAIHARGSPWMRFSAVVPEDLASQGA